MAGGIAGAVALSQFPEFSQQYLQRLSGAVDELKAITVAFDLSARVAGLSREDCPWSGSCAGWCPLEHDAREPGARHGGAPGARGCGLAPLSESGSRDMGDQSPGSVSRGRV